ncbi:hypothetical protein BaRGS_00021037 [Batillaria attramentaria]|uniref:Uncharacterized protein n=1 Tax=Batillaria attramentaria TaxID=370345 RepID=A0ABD0KKQ7_9CAEN
MGTLQIVGIVVGVLVAVICGVTIFTVLMIRGLRRSRRPLPRLPNSVPLAAAPCHFPQDDRASAVYAVIDDEQDNTEGDGYARLPDDTSFERPASLPVDYLHPNAPSSEAAKSPYDMLQPSDQRRQSQPYTSLKASMKSPRGADSMLKDHLQPDATCLPTRSMTADTLRPDDYLHPTALPAETHLPDDYLRPADPSVRLSKSPYDRLQCLGQRLHSAPYTRLQVCARSPPRADSLPGDYLHPTGLHATEDPEQPTLSPRPTGNGLRSPSTAADYLHPIGSPATSNSRPDDYLHPVAPQALVCRVSHAPANETAVDHPASTGSSRTPLGDVATETAASPNQRTETGTSLDHDHEFGEYIEPFQRPQDSRSPRCTPNT